MFVEMISFTLIVSMLGFRHGMDMDHIAAITDMVGAETERKKQLLFGALYAAGHGGIVVVIGFAAISIGKRLSDGMMHAMEMAVGLTLVLLGGFIIFSLIKQRSEYRFKSRIQLIGELFEKLRGKTRERSSAMKLGVLGSLGIGVIHGVGAETPTQVMLLSSTAQLRSEWLALLQLLLFAFGTLAATLLVTFLAVWGYTRARAYRNFYILLGSATGLYSIILGCTMLSGA
ncbi:HoxN/HupN/NixA family nickel/cobalt transporter [Paenibacillus alkalitolerans]|uniref:HoxN/HupN/NixA family nickel/cobalt transporter n=1 Tax=Paenibacillus alkalitolerans TaxID=2799335 RepID=UPI0018F3B2BC|nr:High-affinity nickel-transporter [Paenibacillus alkalitolerans]